MDPLTFLQHAMKSLGEMSIDPKFTLHYSCLTIDFNVVTAVKNGLFFRRDRLIRHNRELAHKCNLIKGQNHLKHESE